MGRIKKIQKHKEERDKLRKFKKTRRKEWRKKKEIFTYVEVPILVCSPSVENALKIPPLCDPPSGKPTHTGTSTTT
jgi:hypothetical protein